MPNARLFRLPKIQRGLDRIGLYETPDPARGNEALQTLAAAFRLHGTAKDAGTRFVFQDDKQILEIYAASDSLRWSTIGSEDPRLSTLQVNLPNHKAAKQQADKFLKAHLVDAPAPTSCSVFYTELSVDDRGKRKSGRTHVHACYRYSLGDLPLFGPGAKTQVTIGEGGAVTEGYHFWRTAKLAEKRTTIGPERALDLLMGSDMFEDLNAKTASVTFEGVELGYFALPPREVQGLLIPVYRVRGLVVTKQLSEYRFVKHVVAIEHTDTEVKQRHAVASAPRSIF